MEINPTNRSIVLIERSHQPLRTIIPQQDRTTVQTRQNQWLLGVETQPIDSFTRRFQSKHHFFGDERSLRNGFDSEEDEDESGFDF